jgi:hypothetical protein
MNELGRYEESWKIYGFIVRYRKRPKMSTASTTDNITGSDDVGLRRKHGRQTAGISRGGSVSMTAACRCRSPNSACCIMHAAFHFEVIGLHWTAFQHLLLRRVNQAYCRTQTTYLCFRRVSHPGLIAYRRCYDSLEGGTSNTRPKRPIDWIAICDTSSVGCPLQ